jgi:hypothetical protein
MPGEIEAASQKEGQTPTRKTGLKAKGVRLRRLKLPFSYNIITVAKKIPCFQTNFRV